MGPYLQISTTVEALAFDGTRDSALAIAKAFPDRVALSVEHDDELLAVSDGRLVPVPKGWWVVEIVSSGALRVMDPTSWRIARLSHA